MHIEYVAFHNRIDAPNALKNLQHAAQTALKHTTQEVIRAPLLAQIYVEIARLLFVLPSTPQQRQHALMLAQKGLDLATRLHHSPLQLNAQHAIWQATHAE